MKCQRSRSRSLLTPVRTGSRFPSPECNECLLHRKRGTSGILWAARKHLTFRVLLTGCATPLVVIITSRNASWENLRQGILRAVSWPHSRPPPRQHTFGSFPPQYDLGQITYPVGGVSLFKLEARRKFCSAPLLPPWRSLLLCPPLRPPHQNSAPPPFSIACLHSCRHSPALIPALSSLS